MRACLSVPDLRELDELTQGRTTEFEQLPERYQQAILEVEREVYGEQAEEIVAKSFGPPRAPANAAASQAA